jgi:GAF domain-containing protein
LCQANFGTLLLCEGDFYRQVAFHNAPPAFVEARRLNPMISMSGSTALARLAATKRPVHIADVASDPAYQIDSQRRRFAALTGVRTNLAVPMLIDDKLTGALNIYRTEVRPFTDKQIALVQNFAAQAVIAIENTRLLNELRQRTDDLSESLEQQTATSEVLSVISSSPGELEPVFQAVLEKATRICEANFGILFRLDDGVVHLGASLGVPLALAEFMRSVRRPGPHSATARAMRTGQVIHILDAREERGYREGDPMLVFGVDKVGIRTLVAAPMLKDKVPIGSIGVYRTEVRPFTDKQTELLRNFAAQAVIAIENTRLLNELRQSLEQQTATAEVLSVISSSPGNLQPVFEAMLKNAVRICDAKFGNLFLYEGGAIRPAAMHGAPSKMVEFFQQNPTIHPKPGGTVDRALKTKQVVCTVDEAANQIPSLAVELGGARSHVVVPMLKENELVGVFGIYRHEVRAFTDKQIELLTNFAAQAVIAIENTRLLNELRQRTADLTESLEQQTATADVLRVISNSPGDLEPVFETMLASARRICKAEFGILYLCEGDGLRAVAMHNVPPVLAEARKRGVNRPDPRTGVGLAVKTRQPVQIPDLSKEQAYLDGHPHVVASVELGGIRTTLNVPMLKEDQLIGAIVIYRQRVQPFEDKQIELVQNFAAQAVIAIENTRLLNELRQRTDDLTESLEQQTATSDVLRVISSSPGELVPVFQAMLENAVRICEAAFGSMLLREGDGFRRVALHNAPVEYVKFGETEPLLPPTKTLARILETMQAAQVADMAVAEPQSPISRLGGARTLLNVPMIKENELIGVFAVFRQEVRPFTDKQIELVKNFAAQAVIAIENTRLLNELRQSLQQQTATADVLKVISSSPGKLEPVFQAMLENATRICEAKFGTLFRFDGDAYHLAGQFGTPPELAEFQRQRGPFQAPPGGHLEQITRTKQVRHTADEAADLLPGKAATLGGARSTVYVPMLKDDQLIGAIVIYRQEVRPFTDKQIELVQNFAAQAVIAIENTRLLNELRESLQQQNATADVLKVISRSTFDLPKVLSTLVESATKLCNADKAYIYQQHDGAYQFAASCGFSAELLEYARENPITPGRGTITGRVVLGGKAVHVEDVLADPEFTGHGYQSRGDFRTTLGVPLTRNGLTIGVFFLARSLVRPFTNKEIDLVTTFADQAVIAIENVRLFDEIQDKSRQLEVASQHKSQFLANMSHELRTPLNAILGYTELMADGIYGQLPEKTMGVLKRLESNGRHLLGLINDVLDLSKIEAGQLVLELTDYSLEDIAQTVRSTLEPLAADKKLAFKVEVAPKMPAGHGDGRRLTQVVINLVGNAIKFTDAGEVVIKATAIDGSFHLSVRDTGPGISAADQAKLFQEFQQADNAITRKKGGTGLGLAISKRIVEMHGGKIWVESQISQGSTFAFTVPVRVERQVEPA